MDAQSSLKAKRIISSIAASYSEAPDIVKMGDRERIDPEAIAEAISDLKELIFAGFYTKRSLKAELAEYYVAEIVERLSYSLKKQVGRAFSIGYGTEGEEADAKAEGAVHQFLSAIPEIRSVLATDVDAAFDGDPAAFSKEEVILSYPGVAAITVNRLAHKLYTLEVPFIPRMMTEFVHGITGIDIHPGASIGHHFFIDHGTGIVIGESAQIGNYVKIYQGVTLGAMSTRGGRMLSGSKRHPTIEDHVTIYSGASILGGSTVIGEGVVIGSNAFITKSVPDGTRVSVKNPELQYRSGKAGKSLEFEQDEFWFYQI
jgi:serine O-acetyltransferase